MSIDIMSESPIPLTRAAAYVPRRRRGRKTASSTLHRWATHGLRGVVLETLQIGGTKCTSIAALQRFFERLSALNSRKAFQSSKYNPRRAELADQELQRRWGDYEPRSKKQLAQGRVREQSVARL
jgi:hypothetical protein